MLVFLRHGVHVDVISVPRAGHLVDPSALEADTSDDIKNSATAFLEGHLHGERLKRVLGGRGGCKRKALHAPAALFHALRPSLSAKSPSPASANVVSLAPTGAASSRAFRLRAATAGA